MLIGAGVCVLTIDSPILVGPISKSLSGSDFPWVLGPPVAGIILLRHSPGTTSRQARTMPSEHLERARPRWARPP